MEDSKSSYVKDLLKKVITDRASKNLESFSFSSEPDSQPEPLTESSDPTFSCVTCSKSFLTQRRLSRHIKRVHDQKPMNETNQSKNVAEFGCIVCQKVFRNKSSLARHTKCVHNEDPKTEFEHASQLIDGTAKNIPCLHCEKTFSSRRGYHWHFSRVHGSIDANSSLDNASLLTLMSRFTCEICGKPFKDRWHLNRHLSGIHDRPDLGSNLDNASMLTLNNKYTCSVCFKPFRDNYHLRQHERVHKETSKSPKTRAATFTCTECDKTFSEKYRLVRHRRTVHKIHDANETSLSSSTKTKAIKVACSYCEKTFRDRYRLRRHIAGVHKDVAEVLERNFDDKEKAALNHSKYKCSQCDKPFKDQWHLSRHERQVHALKVRVLPLPPESDSSDLNEDPDNCSESQETATSAADGFPDEDTVDENG